MERYEIEGSPDALDDLRPKLKALYADLPEPRLVGLDGGPLSAEFEDLPEVVGAPPERIRAHRLAQVEGLIVGACDGSDLSPSAFEVKLPGFWA
jgi:hypothetical protein